MKKHKKLQRTRKGRKTFATKKKVTREERKEKYTMCIQCIAKSCKERREVVLHI